MPTAPHVAVVHSGGTPVSSTATTVPEDAP
jgi:hypothetical protein